MGKVVLINYANKGVILIHSNNSNVTLFRYLLQYSKVLHWQHKVLATLNQVLLTLSVFQCELFIGSIIGNVLEYATILYTHFWVINSRHIRQMVPLVV